MIENKVKYIETENNNNLDTEPNLITRDELDMAIRQLNKGKSVGPDDIPNEAIINMNKKNRDTLRQRLNEVYTTKQIPEEWREGEIIIIYKGKGTKGKCSNERGRTLSSNMGKLFERIINNRIQTQITMTPNQGGGQKGKATVDYILRIQNIINNARKSKQTIHITFLDVTKAYDKAWNKAIMYTLDKSGIKRDEWTIAKKLNENITARIRKNNGQTRRIQIKDSIRQGGVLAVVEYANMMDEISKELINSNIQPIKTGNEETMGCFLWMDDVVLINTNRNTLQEMLDITYKVASRYRIKFGSQKSKVLTIGKPDNYKTLTIGNTELEETETYKYLGMTLNNKGTLQNHIEDIKGKVHIATQTILNVAAYQDYRTIEMETIWKLYKTCLVPIITYSAEPWNPTAEEYRQLEDIQNTALRNILDTNNKTPIAALQIQSGLPTIKEKIHEVQINYYAKKIRSDDTKFIEGTQWEKKINKNLETYNIKKEELETLDKNRVANLIQKKINIKRIASLKIKGTTATKTKEMSKNINTDGFNILPPAYITKLPRHLAGIIFKTRSYMLKIRTNMKTTNPDLSCRWCKQYQETQEHIITACTLTPDIDLNKAMTNHNDTLIKEATQLTQIVNLLDKPPDTDVPIRPPDTDIPTRPPDTDIPNRPINILINNNPPDPGKPPDRNIPNRPLDIDIPNRLSDSDQ